MDRSRVLLDTNIWSRLVDANEADRFVREIKQQDRVEVCVAPATLLELQRSPRRASRLARVRLASRSTWTRLPTEARSEMLELAEEIRRVRPGWMRQAPTDSDRPFVEFWSTKIWEASKRDLFDRDSPASAHEEAAIQLINEGTQENRDRWSAEGFNLDTHGLRGRIQQARVAIDTRLAHIVGQAAIAAVDGPIDYWRAEVATTLEGIFSKPRSEPFSTYRQWLDPSVDLEELDRHKDDFMVMLLTEVDPSAMIRNWLRWAMRFAQTAAKVSHGNARDEQLAGYLPDVDMLITNDRTFARLLTEVRAASPTAIGETKFVNLHSVPSVAREVLTACGPT